MSFDNLLKELGQFGKYQQGVYFLACIVSLMCGLAVLVSVYVLYPAPHRCTLPQDVWPNDTWTTDDKSNLSRLVDIYIPRTDENELDKCNIYNLSTLTAAERWNVNDTSAFPKLPCSSWVYDRSQIDETFITQYNLVCGQSYWVPLFKILFMAGMLVGAPLFGWFSDAIGRKKTLLIGVFLAFSTGLSSSFVNHPVPMALLKFLTGASTSALFPCAFVLGIELVGPDRRLDAGMIIEYAFAIGICLVAGVAALIKQWTWIQFTVSVPFFLLFSYWWLMPESPRWLISKGRYDEAMNVLQKAAAVNKVTLPKDCLEPNEEESKPRGNFLDVFRSRVLFIRSINIFYQWLVCAMVYYGLSLNSGNLPGSIYLNGFLSGAVEIPGYAIGHLTLNRFGRKKLHFLSLLLAGIFCTSNILLVYFTPDVSWAFIVVGMIGKLFITSAFGIIYIWTSELFPTSVRSAGVGTSSMFGRVGSMLGPPIGDLAPQVGGNIGKALPLLVFGIVSIIAAFLCLFIPETLGMQLPETIEDGENFGKKPIEKDGHENYAYNVELDQTKEKKDINSTEKGTSNGAFTSL